MKPSSSTPDQRFRQRVIRTMFKEMICSEHGAACFIEATRRDNAKKRAAKAKP
jgi:hypothetical protein